jgi:hypothetical protein
MAARITNHVGAAQIRERIMSKHKRITADAVASRFLPLSPFSVLLKRNYMSGQHAHGCERRSNHERQGNEHRPPLDAQAEAAGAAVLLPSAVCAQGWAHGSKHT